VFIVVYFGMSQSRNFWIHSFRQIWKS